MNIVIKSIPHARQRYETCGDWWSTRSGDQIRVSDLGNEEYHFLIALHELIEFWLCRRRGISDTIVTTFDRAFPGDDPGDDPSAPYYREHTLANAIERLVAEALGVDWAKYNRALERLPAWTAPTTRTKG